MARIRYRLWQFGQELWVRPLPATAWQTITHLLAPAEIALFHRFSRSDQVHSFRVMESLRAAGVDDPVLLKAALLHDIGKTRVPLFLWDRVLIVVGKGLMPQRAAAWGRGEATGWRKAFVVKAQHADWGADMVAAVGGETAVIDLIRRHQDDIDPNATTEQDERLRQLQWADDQN